ncbi:hypothetical protein ES703_74207 [subsurface metagenome]
MGIECDIRPPVFTGGRVAGDPLLDGVKTGILARIVERGAQKIGKVNGTAEPHRHASLAFHIGKMQLVHHHPAPERITGVRVDDPRNIPVNPFQGRFPPDINIHVLVLQVVHPDTIGTGVNCCVGLILKFQAGQFSQVDREMVAVVPAPMFCVGSAGIDQLADFIVVVLTLPQAEPELGIAGAFPDEIIHAFNAFSIDIQLHAAVDQEGTGLLGNRLFNGSLILRWNTPAAEIEHQGLFPQADGVDAVVFALNIRR